MTQAFLDREDIKQRIWISDSEVFKHNTLWVMKHYVTGETLYFHNDSQGVANFIAEYNPILVGYNFRDYDSYILKATLLGWTPEETQQVSLTIIQQSLADVWQMFKGEPWVTLPPIIDLFHDIVPRRGLKQIEANLGMSIVESNVDFMLERELTQAEFQDVLKYCIHDVDATEVLFNLRKDNYVASKALLAELAGLDPLEYMKHTNARVVSEALQAQRIEELPYEEYEPPTNVNLDAIPKAVLDYFRATNTNNCLDKGDTGVEFDWFGCPTKVARGGIHAALPNYSETATASRVILNQDVNSYYPSLILNNQLLSRATSSDALYRQFYDLRLEAKAQGDTATADAAKLVLNTTFGAQKDKYNKLFDPMQATRICFDGQLYILDLTYALATNLRTFTLIQLNTDGWMFSLDKSELSRLDELVNEWSKRTGLGLGTDHITKVIQPNVNNYIIEQENGKIKAKGGIVANHKGGDFKSNSATIIDYAVVNYCLNGVQVRDTIEQCNDVMRYQIIAKAGHTYSHIVHNNKPLPQKVNRVFATTDTTQTGIFKVKPNSDTLEKIALTPKHCVVMNKDVEKNAEKILQILDKEWYIKLAEAKVKDFYKQEKEKEMSEEITETKTATKKPAPKRKTTKKEPVKEVVQEVVVPSFKEKLLELQHKMRTAQVEFEGMIDKINYSYADTQQYKQRFSEFCTNAGLVHSVDMVKSEFLGIVSRENPTRADIYGAVCDLVITIADTTSDEFAEYKSSGIGMNTGAGYTLGVAETNALRGFLLNNFMLDNQGREGDDQKMNGESVASDAKKGYVTPAAKAQIQQSVVAKAQKTAQYATDLFAIDLYEKIKKAQEIEPTFCAKFVTDNFNADGTPHLSEDGKSTILKTDAVKIMTKAEEMIDND